MAMITATPRPRTAPEAAGPRTWRIAPAGSRADGVRCAAVLTAAAVAGAAALVAADHHARWDRGGEFALFWLGMLVFTLPAAWWAVRRASGARLRLAVLIGYGCFTYLPKLLRNPDGPLYHDEYAHWRQSYEIVVDGQLFGSNPIVRVIGDYPGLHSAVASLSMLTGCPVWQIALLVLVLAHVLAVLGIAALAGQLWPDPRIAAAAALIYSLNSSFLFFDTQFGYESLAIGVLIWAVVGCLRAARATDRRSRTGWMTLTLLLSAGTAVTHHLSALWLTGILSLIAAVLFLAAWRDRSLVPAAGVACSLALGGTVLVGGWLGLIAPRTRAYLDPYLGRALDQFGGMAGGGSAGRTLFSESVLPWWERAAAFAAPVCMGLATAAAALLWWRRRRSTDPLVRAGAAAMLLLGSLYFPATLLILTPAGAEGARRSWAFSYIGIAVAAAPVVIAALDRAHRRRRFAGTALLAGFALVMVGNTAAGMNPSYRFPGPPKFGSDTRSVTPEVRAAAEWLRQTQGRRARLVADRYSGLIFGSSGEQEPATGSVTFPAYDLYLLRPGQPPSAALIDQLRRWRFEFLVVDRRMAKEVPDINVYFEVNEPIAHDGRPAFSRAQLTKFDTMPWLIKMYDGTDLAIYRFDFDTYQRGTR